MERFGRLDRRVVEVVRQVVWDDSLDLTLEQWNGRRTVPELDECERVPTATVPDLSRESRGDDDGRVVRHVRVVLHDRVVEVDDADQREVGACCRRRRGAAVERATLRVGEEAPRNPLAEVQAAKGGRARRCHDLVGVARVGHAARHDTDTVHIEVEAADWSEHVESDVAVGDRRVDLSIGLEGHRVDPDVGRDMSNAGQRGNSLDDRSVVPGRVAERRVVERRSHRQVGGVRRSQEGGIRRLRAPGARDRRQGEPTNEGHEHDQRQIAAPTTAQSRARSGKPRVRTLPRQLP